MSPTSYRELHPGMGQAVAERTILRKKQDGTLENWGDVAHRVSLGNVLLHPKNVPFDSVTEFEKMRKHMASGTILMSGRHLQHGDETQPFSNAEKFTNCSTAATSFLLFLLLLSGSGVGRCYDDDMMLVDWDNAPTLRCVLSESHGDFDFSQHESERDAKHKYGTGKDVMWFDVPDTREGWAKALEIWENAAFEKIHKDKMLILNFSGVRKKNSPIAGMQNRPASGPVPLMNAFAKAATLKGAGLPTWMQAMYIDHYMAECVLVGGARRAARIGVKYWKDKSVLQFITIKRPIEYYGKTVDQVTEYRKTHQPFSFLWSSNNSVGVDKEFWDCLSQTPDHADYNSETSTHSRKVFELVCECSYGDGTGEPGLINVDKINSNVTKLPEMLKGDYIGSQKYTINDESQLLMARLAKKLKAKKYAFIVNPCSEIALMLLCGFCVIADTVPFHANTLEEAEDAMRLTARALIRTNLMDSIYKKEVDRTNRIGVGITGIFEFAWKFFKFGFTDLIDEEKSKAFWMTLARFKRAIDEECISYSTMLGVTIPHTNTTIKPAGTTSKLFGLTEGVHLPPMLEYLRYVQFRHDDPLVQKYIDAGYPSKVLTTYTGTVVIGFPTAPTICGLGMGDKLLTSSQVSPEDQYRWLQLLEKYWINGTDAKGVPLETDTGNQVSYTLKYDPQKVSYQEFRETILRYQKTVKCCSVMPQADTSSYEYEPETPITHEEYEAYVANIEETLKEDIDKVHIDCSNGACPVDFNKP
jgi:ribonucleoside-triphosphate reductase (formate)